ncbi:hypothetical protein QCA50_016626 [Cerrena zonata]|uniref:Uncharacterized protein n=1 Tax=Cerrena zonata TaxID=2478898 RepID=A0AAW0FSP6_9APHY
MLVDQMRAFEGQLDAQINNAAQYYLTPSSSSSSVPSPDVPLPAVTPAPATAPAPIVTSGEYSQPSGSVQGWASTSQGSQAPSPVVHQAPSTGYQYAEPTQQPPIISATPSLERRTSQPMLFASVQPASQPQPQPYAYDIPMYGGVESDTQTPVASTSQDQMQYQAYSAPPPAQEYQYYHSHPTEAAHHWGTAPSHPGGDTLMYPPENSSYEVGNVDSGNVPQHHQYPTPPISSEYHQYQPTQTHSHGHAHAHAHVHSYPQTPISATPQSQYHPQYYQQPMVAHHPPPPTPSALYPAAAQSGVLPVHSEAPYSLQDAWTSFMQHELPSRGGPNPGPGAGGIQVSQNR